MNSFGKKTYVLLKTCESSPSLSKKLSFSTGFFAAFCFTICVASGYDLSWTIGRSIFPQTPPLTQHHENLAARHSGALYTNHFF